MVVIKHNSGDSLYVVVGTLGSLGVKTRAPTRKLSLWEILVTPGWVEEELFKLSDFLDRNTARVYSCETTLE
jgi:hypothetical protein